MRRLPGRSSPGRLILCAALLTGGADFAGGPAAAQETAAAQNELRLQQLEDQIRALTGEVETQTHQIAVLNQQVEKMRADTTLRLNDLEGRGAGAPAAADDGQAQAASPSAPASPAQDYDAPTPLLPGAIAPQRSPLRQQGPGAPPRSLGTIPAGSGAEITPEQQDEAAAQAAAAGMTPEGQYQAAYAFIGQGRYADAERAFKAFLAQHPKDALASSAAYWIGHSYYATGEFQSAAVAFADGYKKYPKGIKAPDTLLDLGRTLSKLGSAPDACATFAQFDKQFGVGATPAIKKQEQQEKIRLKCG